MYKEAIICIITIILIVFFNIITENYTRESVSDLTNNLFSLRNEITEENVKDMNVRADNILKNWNNRYEKLAYYLEHDELEKVGNSLTALSSAIYSEDYSETISKLDESVFILKHIEEKNRFDLKNIF